MPDTPVQGTADAVVAVTELPVQEPELPVTLPVTFPVSGPEKEAAVSAPVKDDPPALSKITWTTPSDQSRK